MTKAQYKDSFIAKIDELFTVEELPSPEERVRQTNEFIEKYFDVVGEKPPALQLERLGNYLLLDYLRDKDKNKSKKS
ncbi:hypothetical protein [Geomicrobium sp. JCM 19055]|uniref:hypothetical protein n=1 Tax=Geomicrobium sp. JCM 19055 TaxID=1460649 RepID=UPI00045ECD20|nr:hypothetical protein [Geomicrobium sp. JCM 19055]GAK00869.1 hypothetical protein JCM19055_3987 [Geomicrobium sp. JCM 19055]